jgi:hypothetical protein
LSENRKASVELCRRLYVQERERERETLGICNFTLSKVFVISVNKSVRIS